MNWWRKGEESVEAIHLVATTVSVSFSVSVSLVCGSVQSGYQDTGAAASKLRQLIRLCLQLNNHSIADRVSGVSAIEFLN